MEILKQCDPKQKALAMRVYVDLKHCRHWKILNVHYYVGKKVIFFLGSQQTTQPLVFILPVSSDDAYSTDELFNLTKNLKEYVTHQHVQSVLLAIISNDFTISYYKLTNGLFSDNHLSMPSQTQMEIQLRSSTSEKRSLSNVDDEPIVEQIKFPRINEDKEEELIVINKNEILSSNTIADESFWPTGDTSWD